MKRLLLFFATILISNIIISQTSENKIENVAKLIKETKDQFAPDRRVKVFEISAQLSKSDNSIILKGSSTERSAKDALVKKLNTAGINAVDEIKMLPDVDLKDRIYGLTNQSVINLRYEPDYSSESATQTILGTPLMILEKSKGWSRVVTPEGYIAWVSSGSVTELTKEELTNWAASERVIITKHYVLFKKEAKEDSEIVMDGVMGSIVVKDSEAGDFCKVLLPNGKSAYVHKKALENFNTWISSSKATPDNIIRTAKKFLGFPYMWGGTSIKAVDCSGFTKSVFYLNGVILERDASQQALYGEDVILEDSKGKYKNLEPADLLFFGSKASEGKRERITHVAIYIGNGEFIHSATSVKINSLIEGAYNYNDVERRIVRARRVINSIDKSDGIVSIKIHPWYIINE